MTPASPCGLQHHGDFSLRDVCPHKGVSEKSPGQHPWVLLKNSLQLFGFPFRFVPRSFLGLLNFIHVTRLLQAQQPPTLNWKNIEPKQFTWIDTDLETSSGYVIVITPLCQSFAWVIEVFFNLKLGHISALKTGCRRGVFWGEEAKVSEFPSCVSTS